MIVLLRGVKRVVAAGAVALVLTGCGGASDEADVTTPPSTTSRDVEGGALAGVQFDVRRDPG